MRKISLSKTQISAAAALLLVSLAATVGVFLLIQHELRERAIDACLADEEQKLQCLGDLVLTTLKEKGLSASLDMVATLYAGDEDFAADCHSNLHEIGREAYRLYEQGVPVEISDKTTYCGFGFFHGFLEELIFVRGSASTAGVFCRNMEKNLTGSLSRSMTACFHGIGHGVIDGTDPRTWGDQATFIAGGLSICKEITVNDGELVNCGSGIFNSLAISYHNPKYALNADPSDPFRFCRVTDMPAPLKISCYDQMNTYALYIEKDLRKAVSFLSGAEHPYKSNALNGIASFAVKSVLRGEQEKESLLQACASLGDLSASCMESVMGGFFEFGKPGEEFVAAADFCREAETLKDACVDGFARTISGLYTPEFRGRSCDYLEKALGKEDGARCLLGVKKYQDSI